jgi:hypothetical protein
LGAALRALIVLRGLISLVLVSGAPGQVALVSGQGTSSFPPQIEVSLSLKNGGWVDVRANPVIRTTFILGNGSTISQGFYFDALNVPAGGVTRSSWNLSFPLGSLGTVNLTAYLRMRGPMLEAPRTYRVPWGRTHTPNKIKGAETGVWKRDHGD